MTKQIDKTIGLMDLFEKYPNVGPILMKHGLHCLGCAMASFETLEQGAKAHGMDDKKIDKMVEEINALTESKGKA